MKLKSSNISQVHHAQVIVCLLFSLILSACSTTKNAQVKPIAEDESREDVRQALGSIAGAISGKDFCHIVGTRPVSEGFPDRRFACGDFGAG